MDIEKYLSNFFKGTKDPSLDAMKFFMEEFNHPEKSLKFIHIAGTNGKGSCAQMISNILIKSGYKVGKFMSPHLINYNERISIQNQNISNEEMEKLINKIEPKIEEYNFIHKTKVTLFELEATMGILYFFENKCDFVVLETGLGGLYDCTNIVNPLVSIITSIGYDHMNILGNTIEEIATQKAGIIKNGSETIFVEQNGEEVNNIIKQTCIDKNSNLHLIKENEITNYSFDKEYQKFDYKNYKDIVINLKGKKQIYNACICIECMQILKSKSCFIDDNVIREELKKVIHKGRFEKIYSNPSIIFDGAHNKPAIENFTKNVSMYYPNENRVYITSILKTKDYQSIIKELVKDEEATFVFTDGNDKESYVPKEEMLKIAKENTTNKKLYVKELNDSISLVKQNYKDSINFFVGSFYIYAAVIDNLKEEKNDKY